MFQKLGLEEGNRSFLLMHSIVVNVSGRIASVFAAVSPLNKIG